MKQSNHITIGLIVDWFVGWEDTPYYQTMILAGASRCAEENGASLVCFVTGRMDSPHDWEKSRNVLFDYANASTLDGLIVLASSVGFHVEKHVMQSFLEAFKDLPVITIGEGYGDFPHVTVDNKSGLRAVIDHLIEDHGSRRIAFIQGTPGNSEAEARYEAYRESLKAHSINFDRNLVVQGDFLYQSGGEAVKILTDQRQTDYDTIVAANDNMAIGAIWELAGRGILFKKNIRVAGFDDTEASENFSLTTVRQNFEDQGYTACQSLLKMIDGEVLDTPRIEVPSCQVIRASCGCLSHTVMAAGNLEPSEQFDPPAECGKLVSSVRKIFPSSLLDKNITARHLDGWSENLWQSLNSEDGQYFLTSWEKTALGLIISKTRPGILHEILTAYYVSIHAFRWPEKQMSFLDTLFQQARIIISEAIERTESSYRIFSYYQTDKLDRVGEQLIASLDLSSQTAILNEALPQLGIHTAFTAVYQNPSYPLSGARYIMGISDGQTLPATELETVFAPDELLSKAAIRLLNGKRITMIVQALYHGENQLGFIMFEYASVQGKIYEIMRQKISIALKASLLIDKIRHQADNLEKEVVARTADLRAANINLEKEVRQRKSAEGQLKKALKQLAKSNKILHGESQRDELTGLYNRRGFLTLAREHYDYALEKKQGFLVIYADMDNLKKINDQFGHPEGDNAIRMTAEVLRQIFRTGDIVSRLGGDEFTMIALEATPAEWPYFKERICRAFEKTTRDRMLPYPLSVSLGAEFFDPVLETEFDELLKKADESLYTDKQRKKQGGGCS